MFRKISNHDEPSFFPVDGNIYLNNPNEYFYSSNGALICCQGYLWNRIQNRCISIRRYLFNLQYFFLNLL